MSSDNQITNPTGEGNDSLHELCERRYSRRDLLKVGAAAAVTLSACGSEEHSKPLDQADHAWQADNPYRSNYNFVEIEHGMDQHHHVAPDHQVQILLRWGDPLFDDAPEFNVNAQSVAAQKRQFGYNNDYIGYIPLEPDSESKEAQDSRALLCVNHEYPIHGLMFPDFGDNDSVSAEQIEISQAACGCSIIEVSAKDGDWQVNLSSPYNRRITSLDTVMEITGPAAGHPRLCTQADPTGRRVIGTLNNCAGGITPWGTFLTCEENFNYCFNGELAADHPEGDNHARYNVPLGWMNWGKYQTRFDVSKEPNEPNRFGWVVEIDPLDPTSKPKKRTALGRFKHEGGENIVASDGRLVIYMGDDQRFEYLYKFVSTDVVNLNDKTANRDLLDKGTLYVAKFYAQGYLEWLPLVHSNTVLSAQFNSQADILIEPRRAADLLGATPMDRPEDVVPNHKTGKVYVMLTNNAKRTSTDQANPRTENVFGHIIEISEHDNNHSATRGYWDMLVSCGDPKNNAHKAEFHAKTSDNGWFASPDNGAIDPSGRLWVSTDQGAKTNLSGTNDGLWALETQGPNRGLSQMFFRVPMGAEMSGPVFSQDGESLFLAVQHPGDEESKPGTARIHSATTRWPDFQDELPPRPSLVVVTRKGGGQVG